MSAARSPLRAVLAEFNSGAVGTLDEVAARTGLRRDVVDAAVEHLVRTRRITAQTLTAGCPTGGCGGCPSAEGLSGCPLPGGPTTTASPQGPVLVALSLRRPA